MLYNSADGWKTYTINVGDYFTGSYNRLIFMNDNDTPNNLGSSSQFRNLVLSETTPPPTTNQLNLTINGTTISKSLQTYGDASILNGNNLPQDTSEATVTYLDNGNQVQVENNAWKSWDLGNYNITSDTVLTFEFRSDSEGEIQGIGFDNNDNVFDNTNTLFQLFGTQTFGNQTFNNYNTVEGWKSYTINVGDYFTGTYNHLVFMNDNDTPNNLGSSSQFRNIILSENTPPPPTNNPPVANNDSYTTDEATILNENFVINDEDTDNDPLIITQINGSIFTEGNPITLSSGALLTINNDQTFSYNPNSQFDYLLAGETATDTFTYTISDGQDSDNGTVTVTINGLSSPPTTNQLNLTINGTNQSKSLQTYGDASVLNGNNLPQDTPEATVTYLDNGNQVEVENNAWKSWDLGNYNITSDTVLTFEFRSDSEGEIQGIGFDNNDNVFDNTNTLFQLFGTQSFGNQTFNNYNTVEGWKSYTINVGDFLTGTYNRLVFMNDNDTPNNLGSSSQFRNLILSENTPPPPTNQLNLTINGTTISKSLQTYGDASVLNGNNLPQDTSEATVTYLDHGNQVKVENNAWKSWDLGNYNITANTRLSFQFRSVDEGEIQGIGFDNDDDLFNNTNTLFQLYGTQTFANQAFNDYQGLNDSQAVNGWKDYSINLGQYFTGNFDRLVFMNDNDTINNLGSSSQFRNLVLSEVT
ncbi:Ig-like domain-containing protein [Crocosphaera chwakensis]|uniref:VCBS repeat domain protein n=1 Tax=Crocosphaera chwakensis CCY0110 TaxID=391612 RepID=A3IRF7_9CHRO|nr:Ig-like domain-containing protein [Crocosphaera chwakensis]EAZ90959.1 VCBS repeat domain protein [Crocosphaera chwakensis CCY0110]